MVVIDLRLSRKEFLENFVHPDNNIDLEFSDSYSCLIIRATAYGIYLHGIDNTILYTPDLNISKLPGLW